MNVFKQYVNEEKSISEDVKLLADYIGKAIFKDSINIEQKLSKIREIPFIENEFVINVNDALRGGVNNFGLDTLTIKYILYNCDSKQEYYQKVFSYGNNSEASFEDKKIIIVSGMIKGYILPDFIDDIYHELTHLLQYGMGMEKRVNLYDAVQKMLITATSKVEEAILRIIYMSFKHEQDAFAHQFYSFLRRSKEKNTFENLVNKSEYGLYKKFRTTYFYGKTFESETVDNVLSNLGMNREQFEKRMNYGASRLRTKLKNAYDKYLIDIKSKTLKVETNLKYDLYKDSILMEYRKRYTNLEYGIESIYEIIEKNINDE